MPKLHVQDLKPLATQERVESMAPGENTIYLMPPPFLTVRELSVKQEFWHWPIADPGGIDFDLALLIGDFGVGSDAPILLDYRGSAANPPGNSSPVGKRCNQPMGDNGSGH